MLKIDNDFPGANIQVHKNNDYSVEIDTDLRDTSTYWFYWSFKATADKAGKYNFKFRNAPAMTGAGPVVSFDKGASWEYLGKEKVDFEKESFDFVFEDAGRSVMFSFAIPYLEENWRLFTKKFKDQQDFFVSKLDKTSRENRDVEFAKIACDADCTPKKYIMLTARHHCCEMTASYAIEGIIEYAMANESFRNDITLLVVPFVDKDGVENGDQGKNRMPHDHARDYTDNPLYPEIQEIMSLVRKYQPQFILDLHCPYIRNIESQNVYLLGKPGAKATRDLNHFSDILEKNSPTELLYFKRNNVPFGTSWNNASNYKKGASLPLWANKLPWQPTAITLEMPYSIANGNIITPNNVRLFGHSIAKSLQQYLNNTNKI